MDGGDLNSLISRWRKWRWGRSLQRKEAKNWIFLPTKAALIIPFFPLPWAEACLYKAKAIGILRIVFDS